MENLDEVLKGEPEKVEEPAAEPMVDEPSSKVDPPSDRLRDEKGRFAPKETGVEQTAEAAPAPVEAPPASSQLPRDVYEPLKAVRDENRELKRQIAAIQQQMAQPLKPQQPPVDFWDDPQGFMSSQMQSFGDTLLQQWEQRQQAQRLDASERAARNAHEDYDEAFAAFEQAVQANPRLAVELAQSDNPGEFAYQRGKTALTLNQVGSIDALKAQLRAEWEAEVKAAAPTPRPNLPSTTAADGSVGARTGPAWSGPESLKDILG